MITVVMGGGAGPEDTYWRWLERAMAAQCDDLQPYRNVLWGLRPRWGGSHEQMIEFGLACLATRRFDTGVPQMLFEALIAVALEVPDWRPLYRDPTIAAAVMDLGQALIDEPTRAPEQWRQRSHHAAKAWMTGNYAIAAQTLEALDFKLHPSVPERLATFKTDEATFISDTLIWLSDCQQAKGCQCRVFLHSGWSVVFFMVWLLVRVNDWRQGFMSCPPFKCGSAPGDGRNPRINERQPHLSSMIPIHTLPPESPGADSHKV